MHRAAKLVQGTSTLSTFFRCFSGSVNARVYGSELRVCVVTYTCVQDT